MSISYYVLNHLLDFVPIWLLDSNLIAPGPFASHTQLSIFQIDVISMTKRNCASPDIATAVSLSACPSADSKILFHSVERRK